MVAACHLACAQSAGTSAACPRPSIRPKDHAAMTQGFFLLVFVVIGAILLFQWLFSSVRRVDVGPHRARGTRIAATVSSIVPRAVERPPDTTAADAAAPTAAGR